MRIGPIRLTGWMRSAAILLPAAALLAAGVMRYADAAPGNVSLTMHNLSRTGTGTTKAPADGETEICVFCHTPHGATTSVKAPLWNRSVGTGTTYTRYSSSSLDANSITDGFNAQPGGSSLLCLSCHDGTLALGNVNVLRGAPATITLNNTNAGKMHPGASTNTTAGSSRGLLTGYTRVLSDDLSNDHPISITFNDALSARDGEMQRLTTTTPAQRDTTTNGNTIAVRGTGTKPLLPLEPTGTNSAGQVQCATCHDPHLNKEKFLRLNRYQVDAPGSNAFSEAGDQICLACHRKLGMSWAQSAHANNTSGNYVYKDEAADLRGFTRGKKVWEIACLNCHDTHTASGSRRLLREGTGTTANSGPAAYQSGSATKPLEKVSSIENTCYQCHTTSTKSILTVNTLDATTGVPDIWTEFERPRRMPIKTADQWSNVTGVNSNDTEIHDITDANFMESQAKLGNGNHMNRHVECTDCHNPHRVMKNSLFNGEGSATRRTHVAGGANGNLASGALRGTWGVEPTWTKVANGWPEKPSFTASNIRSGDPGTSVLTDRGQPFLTREYQLCLKCHSNYGAGDTMPLMTNTMGGTPSNTNSIGDKWTNVAAELTVDANDARTGTDQGASTTKRSWHPVHFPTGRDRAARGMASTGDTNIRPPFEANMGLQTMHCSDCHGNSGGATTNAGTTSTVNSWIQGSGPDLTRVQGPHGSESNFLLRGSWVAGGGTGAATPNSPAFCGNCHRPSGDSGFDGSDDAVGHTTSEHGGRSCTRCHIAVPHGWKNKAFLVNLRCVQTEAGGSFTSTCSNMSGGGTSGRSYAPYYVRASLSIGTWATSGSWGETNCSGKDYMTNNCETSP